MKKFARHKTLDEIRAQCDAQNVRLDTTLYDRRGYDTVVVGGPIELGDTPSRGHVLVNDFNAYVIYSVVNGKFFGRTHRGVEFDSNETEHEREPWFQALLSFFYVEKTEPASV